MHIYLNIKDSLDSTCNYVDTHRMKKIRSVRINICVMNEKKEGVSFFGLYFTAIAIQIDIFIIYLVINLWLPPKVVERIDAECCLDILDISIHNEDRWRQLNLIGMFRLRSAHLAPETNLILQEGHSSSEASLCFPIP